jgi:DNA-directed RNA polymerase I, II, and III subunit RPABC2
MSNFIAIKPKGGAPTPYEYDSDAEGFSIGGGGEDSDDGDDEDVKPKASKKKSGSDDDEDDEPESDNDSEADVSESEDESEDEDSVTSKEPTESALLKIQDDEESDSEEEDDDDVEENYLQKFDESLKTNIIAEHYPELKAHNNDEVDIMTRVVRNEAGVIVDPLHRTLPFITKYEKSRVLGERAKQLNSGAKPFVEVDASLIDGYLIALKEFEEKKIPFIVKRPLPNGGCEYWKLQDLEML